MSEEVSWRLIKGPCVVCVCQGFPECNGAPERERPEQTWVPKSSLCLQPARILEEHPGGKGTS